MQCLQQRALEGEHPGPGARAGDGAGEVRPALAGSDPSSRQVSKHGDWQRGVETRLAF